VLAHHINDVSALLDGFDRAGVETGKGQGRGGDGMDDGGDGEIAGATKDTGPATPSLVVAMAPL